MGVSVCRMYKALFSFSLLGLVATFVAVGLDVHVQKRAGVRGRFQGIGMVGGEGKRAQLEEDGAESNPNPSAASRQGRGGEGYALPDEQFAYGESDTGYHGAAGQVGRRSFEERI